MGGTTRDIRLCVGWGGRRPPGQKSQRGLFDEVLRYGLSVGRVKELM